MSAALYARVARTRAEALAAGLARQLETRDGVQGTLINVAGRRLVNFTSNDYLGLAADPRVVARVADALPGHGFGAGAAALLSGRSGLHAELETRLCEFTGAEAALLFSSGYLANLGALPALAERSDYIAHDRLNHASLIDGVLASRAHHRRYPHRTIPDFTVPASANATQRFLVTESVFSMDGDSADLCALAQTACAADALLYVDDAHGFGITGGGPGAASILAAASLNLPATLIMVTFGKAFGSVGAAILGPASLIEHLVGHARTFIYDTALPAVCAAAALAALDILDSDDTPLTRLDANVRDFRAGAHALGIPLMPSSCAIQPIPIGSTERAVDVANALVGAGYYVRAIRPPTVPRGTARLRITLSAAHTPQQIAGLLECCAALTPSFAAS